MYSNGKSDSFVPGDSLRSCGVRSSLRVRGRRWRARGGWRGAAGPGRSTPPAAGLPAGRAPRGT